jgi:hypothetical protein
MYLTNSTLLLRATAVLENRTPHLISNEEAAAGFEASLLFWLKNLRASRPATLINRWPSEAAYKTRSPAFGGI